MATDTKITWFTETTYIDTTTGEVITKQHITNGDYIITNTKKTYHHGETIRITKITNECRPSGQLKLNL